MPPAHPRCACVVEYIEVETSGFEREFTVEFAQNDFINTLEDDIMQTREVASDGKRNEQPLTESQIAEATEAIRKQGYTGDVFL